ncbi:MAG: NTP transferase domain-containing protein, partial [Acidobacteriales bacterium]|nr:NTP transferase domain-containing protein [Terriglobales bacterium]
MSIDAIAIIPARLASTRLPRKILREILGKTMLERVYTAASACPLLREVIVATDADEIASVCRNHNWRVEMTSTDHRSGTDRVHEVAQRLLASRSATAETVFVNVQGDEPLARPEHIDALLRPMADGNHQISTIWTPCSAEDVA